MSTKTVCELRRSHLPVKYILR